MTKLETINAEDLQNRTYEPTYFLVEELIPEGLHILAGAPKIGKSWLALWLCLCVAQGQPLWNFATTQGEVLYLSLEDSFQRIQTRLFDLTEDAPSTLHFAIMADTLKHGLEQQIEQFLTGHPDTKLVVIDTLQRVRGTGSDSNLYANDYQDIGLLKKLADKRHIAILLIHHLRKLHDDDPMNMISGSTGLSGAADSTFVLQKSSRLANIASLHCTGRDIPDRTLKLEFGEEDHVWKLLEDSKTCSGASKISTLQLTKLLSELLRADSIYLGSPSALSAKIDPDGTLGITPKKITRLVRESVAALREKGILADTYTYGKKGKTACTAHHIRECELMQIVLDDLRRVTHFARMKERQFAAHINQKNSAELRQEMNRVLRELDAMKKRSAELSKLFKRLYEDNVLGRVTDEQYRMLSGDYTDEQRMLEEQIPQKEQRLAQLQAREANVDAFIEKAKQYTTIDTLTPELLRLFIQRIEIGERDVKYSRNSSQSIRIIYRDIGLVDSAMQPDEQQPKILPPLSEVIPFPA